MSGEHRLVHIVDDDEAVRRSLDFLLSNSGYAIERWTAPSPFSRARTR